jgi:phage shock protein E
MARWIVLSLLVCVAPASAQDMPNPLIDYAAFQENVAEVADLRAKRRISERQFIRMAAEPATVILDARSAEMYGLLHVKGARNLSLPDITAEELARVIPSKDTRILIYCNNNFLNEPLAFPSKLPAASLNIHTINVLHAYGYRNVYELGPLIDIRRSRLSFEGSRAGGMVSRAAR